MTIRFELISTDEFRKLVGITDGYLNNTKEDYELYKEDFPQLAKQYEIYEWLTNRYIQDCNALFEFNDDKPVRLISVDIQPEPEDAKLYRSYSWVIEELNSLADRINNS